MTGSVSKESRGQGGGGNTGTFKAKPEKSLDSFYSDDGYEGGLRSEGRKSQSDTDLEGGSKDDAIERELAKSQINQRRPQQLVAETDDDVKTQMRIARKQKRQ